MELYVHIPFCIKKCNYCDFLSFPAEEDLIETYCQALEKEICLTGEIHKKCIKDKSQGKYDKGKGQDKNKENTVRTIFIGGGTPSILTPKQIRRMFFCLKTHFIIEENAEISIEANPGTLDEEKLETYLDVGINRLSIGLQSTDDASLKRLGRIHTLEEFEKNYELARKLGFKNINIDLMSALPGQTLEQYEETLKNVTAWNPEHISAYSLIIEEGTPFFYSDTVKNMLPDEETERAMYVMTKEILQEKGYERYEISNYAKKGKECVHNLGYWDGASYLGFGLGASSYYNDARFSNERNIKKYVEQPYIPPEEREEYFVLEKKDRMEDYMIFGLRKRKGVSITRFESEYGIPMKEIYGDIIKKYISMGFLMMEEDRLKLTEKGIDVSNYIFQDFL